MQTAILKCVHFHCGGGGMEEAAHILNRLSDGLGPGIFFYSFLGFDAEKFLFM
jgi:hypothetical protein